MIEANPDAGKMGTRRVLIVEDEPLVVMMLEDMLADLGCTVVGTAGHLAGALEKAGTLDIDFAILDMHLGPHQSTPVAEVLAGRGIPFIVATGMGGADLPAPMRDAVVLSKPFSLTLLEAALVRLK